MQKREKILLMLDHFSTVPPKVLNFLVAQGRFLQLLLGLFDLIVWKGVCVHDRVTDVIDLHRKTHRGNLCCGSKSQKTDEGLE